MPKSTGVVELEPKDVDKIILNATDGKQYEAIWDDTGLKVVGEIAPPPPKSMAETFGSPEAEEEDSQDQEDDEQEENEAPAKGSSPFSPPPPVEPPEEENFEPISDSVFKSRLQSIMRDNMYDRRVSNKTRGKLDMKHLFRVATGANNVFTKKEAMKNKKYSIVLCVDTSSSMNDGESNYVAADATFLITKTLQQVGIDVAVVGFGPVVIFKDFHNNADKKLLNKIHASIVRTPGGTPMYNGMHVGYEMLRGREGHKLMIVMADGGPDSYLGEQKSYKIKNGNIVPQSDYTTSDINADELADISRRYNRDEISYDEYQYMSYRKPFHDLIKKHKDVSTVGIGILQGGMEVYVPDSRKINNIEELKPVIINEIKKRVRRG